MLMRSCHLILKVARINVVFFPTELVSVAVNRDNAGRRIKLVGLIAKVISRKNHLTT